MQTEDSIKTKHTFTMVFFRLLKDTYTSWNKNDPWAKSAMIAYYALFSLPSLLIITVHLAGTFFGKEAVEGRVTKEIEGLIGAESAELVQTIIINSSLSENSLIYLLVGIGMLIFGASGVFVQLQKALNQIWGVRADSKGLLSTMKERAVAFGMVLVLGFLMLISFLVNSLISVFSDFIGEIYTTLSPGFVRTVNFIVSQLIMTILFTSIFTILPDVKVRWRTNLMGAFMTTLLFLAGKYLIGFYFSKSDPASAYGAAGSVVLILLWVYYTCLILFFGAEFTVNWALHRKKKIEPSDNAKLSYELEIEELREFKKEVEERRKRAEALQEN